MSQLRQLRALYGGGVVAWTLCLVLTMVRGDGSARQTVVLLGLLAVFLVLLLWSTWCIWEMEAGRAGPGRAAPAVRR
ncbi:hypothetical protein [Streptomyces sp. NPDC046985]|uniref:hypothetical protein n=1 Tax=Streptomyces sp. NPDC046985 TaxID=3155377 RepID=UPI00340D0BCE